MKKNSFRESKRVGDYVLFCDICGQKMWYSQSKVLEPETGKGGLVVCPMDRDAIDYGLVPYKVAPEAIVPIARSNHYTADPSLIPNDPLPASLDITLIDPTSISNPKNELN